MYFPDLLEQYKQSYSDLLALEKKVSKKENSKEDTLKIASMLRNMKDVIYWLETGYDPAWIRKNYHYDYVTKNTEIIETTRVNNPYEKLDDLEHLDFSSFEKQLLQNIVHVLSPFEKEVFTLVNVEGLRQREAAVYLGVKEEKVYNTWRNARKRIQKVLKTLGMNEYQDFFEYEKKVGSLDIPDEVKKISKSYSKELVEEAIDLALDLGSIKEASERTGINYGTLRKYVSESGVQVKRTRNKLMDEAVELALKIGPKKASEKLNVNYLTLKNNVYNHRKQQKQKIG